MGTAKEAFRGDARVRVVSEYGWHVVTVYDGSGPEFGYEVASYRYRQRAIAHARVVRQAFRMIAEAGR